MGKKRQKRKGPQSQGAATGKRQSGRKPPVPDSASKERRKQALQRKALRRWRKVFGVLGPE